VQAIRSGSFLGHHMGWLTQNLSESDRGAMVQAALAQPLGVNVPVAGFAYALGLIRQRPHLLLEKFRLNHDYTMHIFRLNQLVAEIESRCDVPGRLAREQLQASRG
jgi:hypothetical protein